MTRLRRHLTYANVISSLCLFLLLGGGAAWAVDGPLAGQNTVGSADIINNEVQSADIRDANLTTADIRANAVTSGKVLDDSLTGTDIDESSMPGVADGYAFVSAPSTFIPNGDVAESLSHNVDDSDLTIGTDPGTGDPVTGWYCFSLPFDVHNVQVTTLPNDRTSWDATAHVLDTGPCPGAESASVQTFTGSGTPADVPFFVTFF